MSKLSEIRAREQAATEGPWDWDYGVSLRTAWGLTKPNNEYVLRFQGGNDIGICPDPEEDMEFIQESRTDIPYLLDLVKRMGEALGRFSSEFPVPGCGYCTITIEPDGKVTHETSCPIPEARELLKEIKQ